MLIARYRPEEEMILYTISSKIPAKKGETTSRESYELTHAKKGFLTYEFLFIDDPARGLELRVGTVRLRFAKK